MRRSRIPPWLHRLALFATVGLGGFLLDVSLLEVLRYHAGLTLAHAGLVSLLAAASTGWVLHPRLTFSDRRHRRMLHQWPHYLAVNLASSASNYGIYIALLAGFPTLRHLFALAVMPGALTAMLINFACANSWVFR